MLRSLNALRGFDVYAQDHRLGRVYDVCFDCGSWAILFIVLDTGAFFEDPVLIPVSPATWIDTTTKRLEVDSPSPRPQGQSVAAIPASTPFDDPAYYRARELVAYSMRGTRGPNGHLEDVILDDATWTVRCLVIDTGAVAPRGAVRLDRSQHIGFLDPERERARA